MPRRAPATAPSSRSPRCGPACCVAAELTEAYAALPLAHIVECRADKQVVLEDRFIPTVLHVRAATRLSTITTELLGPASPARRGAERAAWWPPGAARPPNSPTS